MIDESAADPPPKAALPWIKQAAADPFVEGRRCRACAAVMVETRLACPACGSRSGFDPFRAASTGRLHAYSIVRRSFPGVAVPFVSAVVDLDDGLTLKGNLIGVAPDPEVLADVGSVRLVFADALGRRDREGCAYIAYFFEPA